MTYDHMILLAPGGISSWTRIQKAAENIELLWAHQWVALHVLNSFRRNAMQKKLANGKY